MRRTLWFSAAVLTLCIPGGVRCQQDQSASQGQQPAQTQPSATTAPGQSASAPQDSLAAAARKAREQKKEAPKAAKSFDNDTIPTTGGISAVGEPIPSQEGANAAGGPSGASAPSASSGGYPNGNDEKGWRAFFARLQHKLEQDQADLDVMQRELSVLDVQYYPDPQKALMQSVTRSDINEKTAKIEKKKKDVQADKQAIDDAESALRAAGGDSGWSR